MRWPTKAWSERWAAFKSDSKTARPRAASADREARQKPGLDRRQCACRLGKSCKRPTAASKDGADIVNIEDIEAIFVDFRLPERFQPKLKRGQTAQLDIDTLPGRQYTTQIQAIDPLIDANGRSVGVRGCIDNRPLQLRPGMFARVTTVFAVRDNARVVPEEAIVPQAGKQFVIKLLDSPDGQSKTTERIEVKVGLRSPGRVEILGGLEPGDTVVTTGQQRIQRDGTAVSVVELASSPSSRPATDPRTEGAGAALAKAAPAPALAGPNPCGVLVSEAPSALVPVNDATTRAHPPAPAAPRDPG